MTDENGHQTRRERRRDERRQFLSRSSLFAVGFVLSLAGALYFAWLIYPLTETTASAAVLQAEYKEDYIYMVSQAYALDNDWPVAEARLNKLNDPNLPNTTLILLENALREGRSPDAIRNLARLAEQLGAEGDTLALFAPTPVLASEPTAVPVTPTPASVIVTATVPSNDLNESASTANEPIVDQLTPTNTIAPATEAITPTPETDSIEPENYRLLSQREVCQANLITPRIEVIVVDQNLSELRGVAVLLTNEANTDRAITGFKSGQSAGYADFAIEPERSYTISMADGSGSVGGLQSGRCANEDGQTGWILQYQSLVGE